MQPNPSCSHGPVPGGRHGSKPRRQCGVMLLALLIFLSILGLAVTKTSEVWSTSVHREREQELLFVGEQYRKAIERYYNASPGSNKVLPPSMEQLLQDNRFPKPQRHLRNLYPDPMAGGDEWGVLKQGTRIIGLYSQSDKKPMKKSGFDIRYAEFSGAGSYREWRFMFKPPSGVTASVPSGVAGGPGAPSAPTLAGVPGTAAALETLEAPTKTTVSPINLPSQTTTGKHLIAPISFSAANP
jgi:type II secretory pathway pseudopilin PulG